MFDLSKPIDASLISSDEQIRRVREQLDARLRDREGLKLSYQRAQIANDVALQETLQTQAARMTLEIDALQTQLDELEKPNVKQKKSKA